MSARLVLSKREAAHLLGIDRGRTLGDLLRSGQLHAVPWGKGERIPLEEVQRLAREGYRVAGKQPRPSNPRHRSRQCDPEALRKLSIDDLVEASP